MNSVCTSSVYNSVTFLAQTEEQYKIYRMVIGTREPTFSTLCVKLFPWALTDSIHKNNHCSSWKSPGYRAWMRRKEELFYLLVFLWSPRVNDGLHRKGLNKVKIACIRMWLRCTSWICNNPVAKNYKHVLNNKYLWITLQTQLVPNSSNSSSHYLLRRNHQYHEEVQSHTLTKTLLQEWTCHQEVLGDNTRVFFQLYQDTSLS